MVSDPGEASTSLPQPTSVPMETSAPLKASSFPGCNSRGSIPSALWLTACLLANLRLKTVIAHCPQGLAIRWLASLPDRASHPIELTTWPGRTNAVTNYYASVAEY